MPRKLVAQQPMVWAAYLWLSGGSQQAKYILTFYGAIYQFKDAFDQGQIPGAYMEMGTSSDQREYVRYVELTHEANAMQKVLFVLQDVLKGLPVFFVNMVDPADTMGVWLQEQPSVIAAESSSRTIFPVPRPPCRATSFLGTPSFLCLDHLAEPQVF